MAQLFSEAANATTLACTGANAAASATSIWPAVKAASWSS